MVLTNLPGFRAVMLAAWHGPVCTAMSMTACKASTGAACAMAALAASARTAARKSAGPSAEDAAGVWSNPPKVIAPLWFLAMVASLHDMGALFPGGTGCARDPGVRLSVDSAGRDQLDGVLTTVALLGSVWVPCR